MPKPTVADLKAALVAQGIEIPEGAKRADLEQLIADNAVEVGSPEAEAEVVSEEATPAPSPEFVPLPREDGRVMVSHRPVTINGRDWVEVTLNDGTTHLELPNAQ